jgi:S1-C subfamily serine protease
MSNLIITVISIALFICVVTSGINYVNQDRMAINQQASNLRNTITQIESAVVAYNTTFGEYPDKLGDMVPQFSSMPSFPAGTSLISFVNNEAANKRYFCFSVDKTPYNYASFQKVQSERSTGSIVISNACGDSSSLAQTALNSNFSVSFYP